MPARTHKTDVQKSDEKPAWVVEEVTAPEEAVEAPVDTHDSFVERVVEEKKPEEPKVPMMLDIDAKSNPLANLGLIIGVVAAFVVGVVVGASGMKLYESKSATPGKLAMKQETPTPTVTVAPTPTTKPIERAQISVAVLNGSGKTGAASKMATFLEALGYKIQRTGNATEDVTGPSEVYLNGDNVEFGKQVAKDLEAEYKVNSEIMGKYDSSAAVVVVVVGSE